MNAPLPAGALNAAALQNHVDASWQERILPALVKYVEVPAKSPAFDPRSEEHTSELQSQR